MDWLRQQAGVAGRPGPADPEESVRSGDEHVVVVIPAGVSEEVQVIVARARSCCLGRLATDVAALCPARARLLERYNGEIGTMRLVGRGVSPAIASPLRLEDLEVSSAQQRAATILSFIPLFIVLAAFTARDADRDRLDGGRARARLARAAAGEPGAAAGDRRGEVAGGDVRRGARRLAHHRARAGDSALHPDARVWRAVSTRDAAGCRAARSGAADVPALDRHPDLPGDIRPLVQGSADLHGHPDPVPHAARASSGRCIRSTPSRGCTRFRSWDSMCWQRMRSAPRPRRSGPFLSPQLRCSCAHLFYCNSPLSSCSASESSSAAEPSGGLAPP